MNNKRGLGETVHREQRVSQAGMPLLSLTHLSDLNTREVGALMRGLVIFLKAHYILTSINESKCCDQTNVSASGLK